MWEWNGEMGGAWGDNGVRYGVEDGGLHTKSMCQSINSTACHEIDYVQIKIIIIMVICRGSSNLFYTFPLTYFSLVIGNAPFTLDDDAVAMSKIKGK